MPGLSAEVVGTTTAPPIAQTTTHHCSPSGLYSTKPYQRQQAHATSSNQAVAANTQANVQSGKRKRTGRSVRPNCTTSWPLYQVVFSWATVRLDTMVPLTRVAE